MDHASMEKIGPYQILGELGRGGMGIVYRAVDPVIGRTVAIKTVLTRELGDATEQEKLKERLFREAKSAGILSHPNIVTIYQAGQDGDILFIAMEFIDGPNLADAIARRRPSVELSLQMLKQAAEALDYAHSKGVIHRDVKPGNLLLQSEGRVKVADFGIAKLASTNLTKTGTTVGSPAYMSPEQIRATPMDGRADQYSLAICAYEVITGMRPFDADTVTSLVFKVVFETPDLSGLASVPGGDRLEPVFRRALAKAAEDRFPTCVAFCDALAAAVGIGAVAPPIPPPETQPPAMEKTIPLPSLQQQPPPVVESPVTPTPTATPEPAPEPSSRRGLMIGIAGGAVALIAGGGYWLYNNDSQKKPDPNKGGDKNEAGKTSGDPGPTNPAEKPAPPELLHQEPAAYTPEAQKAGIEGTVRVRIVINEQGKVEEAEVIKHLDPGLDRNALAAAKLWTFKPAVFRSTGKPVAFQTQVELSFVIPK